MRAQSLDSPTVDHGFFTREGGVSAGVYAGLNCGSGSNDDPAAVRENRARVAGAMGLAPDRLVSLFQVHSPDVIAVDDIWSDDPETKPRADGMVTNRPGIGLGILVADCTPVLFSDAEAGVVGAAHSGWRGAVGGVNGATIDAMMALGARRERIRAAIGPCIHQPSYEVDDGFRRNLIKDNAENEKFFVVGGREGHHQFDLPGYVASRLVEAGLQHIETLDADTYGDEARFFSFRRTTHRAEPDYGRNIAVIRLAGEG